MEQGKNYLCNAFQDIASTQQQASFGSHAGRYQHSCRRREAQRTGAGYDQDIYGQLGAQKQGAIPGARRDSSQC